MVNARTRLGSWTCSHTLASRVPGMLVRWSSANLLGKEIISHPLGLTGTVRMEFSVLESLWFMSLSQWPLKAGTTWKYICMHGCMHVCMYICVCTHGCVWRESLHHSRVPVMLCPAVRKGPDGWIRQPCWDCDSHMV